MRIGFRGGCLPWERWLALLEFCRSANCHVLFSVNALAGRTRAACPAGTLCRRLPPTERPACCSDYSGDWDESNVHEFLRATASAGHKPAGFAFGNELIGSKGIEAHLPPREYAAELRRFGRIVRSVWPDEKPPLLLAPDTNHIDDHWLRTFLAELWPVSSVGAGPRAAADVRTVSSAGDDASDGADESAETDAESDAEGHDVEASSSRSRRSNTPPSPLPLDVVTHHLYPLGAGDDERRSKLLSPKHLDNMISDRLRLVSRLVRNATRTQAAVAVSETGGAYNSGQRGVTDSFGSSFWWLELLGNLGKHAHDFACRQSLVGGHYGFLDLRARQPSPDFWATLLWRRLVSPKALRLMKFGTKATAAAANGAASLPSSSPPPHATAANADPSSSRLATLRAYASCARTAIEGINVMGGVVIMLLNLSPDTAHDVTVELGGQHAANVEAGDPNGTRTSRLDFVLTAESLTDRTVHLNGHPLLAAPDGSMPELEGEPHAGRVITLAPLSFGFFVFPEATSAPCLSAEQKAERKRSEKAAKKKGKKKGKTKSGGASKVHGRGA